VERDPFDDVTAAWTGQAGVELGRMIRSRGLKVHGRFVCFRRPGAVAVKLPAERVDALVASGRERFDRGDGRPLREWVLVPDDQADEWPGLLEEAVAYRRSQLDET
jgi:hypothetical protein